MTFKEANDSSIYEIVNNFEIEGSQDKCIDCSRVAECKARIIFHADYKHDTIKKCRYFKEET